ncbi:DUF6943 family protein [Bergeyella zoohelcum]|uniref:Uncharacterized protein n=1 Tax=Bergeyella zoohelcum TaxID=1015 RepID=A0A7Z8YR83_9FLAO|nr:hypothetical protein [Bergeyella zoohelcum]VDH05883.1 Uncharacterised protein [Bergeyella zoohelcum]
MKIKRYNGTPTESEQNEMIFYIQSHGYNAGKPLRNPISNCWEYRTQRPQDFEILTIVFQSKILKTFIIGSVIPFLRLDDYRKVIAPILEKGILQSGELNAKYLQIRKIEDLEKLLQQKQKLYTEMKQKICVESIKKLTL